MDYLINGGKPLRGVIADYGAKNCALTLLGATVLTDDEVILHNCPDIVDVDNMLKLLQTMGKKIIRCGDTVAVSGALNTLCAPKKIATLLRGSALIMGGAVAKYGRIALPLPGGCAIGSRPMDIHLCGFEEMGVEVMHVEDMLSCKGFPHGAKYKLRFASVGATENLLCACVLAKGDSVLYGCATEPEVAALGQMLSAMGAKIRGVGSAELHISGVNKLHGTEFTVIPDRIVAATYIAAAAATLGEITVTDCVPQHLKAFLDVLRPYFRIKTYDDCVFVGADKTPSGYGEVETAPYPLFPTDMQSLLLTLAALSRGKTVIKEKLFENRLRHNAEQLNKMGANITVTDDTATVWGEKLHAADIVGADLRGGAGLIIAALAAHGKSTVGGIEHVNRGYADLAGNLNALGADVALR